MLRKLSYLAAACFIATLTACGPMQVVDAADMNDNSTEANEFRKAAGGTWNSDCATFTENRSLRSISKSLQVSNSTVRTTTKTYANGLCKGAAAKTDLYNWTMKVIDYSGTSQFLIELVNKSPTDSDLYRQSLKVELDRHNNMTVTIVKLSMWYNDAEEALTPGDFAADKVTTYSKDSN